MTPQLQNLINKRDRLNQMLQMVGMQNPGDPNYVDPTQLQQQLEQVETEIAQASQLAAWNIVVLPKKG